ncbi:unnamed protein product [Dracunculus medinensis]|uniref:Uncharacterized protein n=1 Tax=Dracunculus medinensis TaxID=318479 RepID=A0A0N4UQ28_DRAME|nr:unnamed protein product [Dracunculus medinensis]
MRRSLILSTGTPLLLRAIDKYRPDKKWALQCRRKNCLKLVKIFLFFIIVKLFLFFIIINNYNYLFLLDDLLNENFLIFSSYSFHVFHFLYFFMFVFIGLMAS